MGPSRESRRAGADELAQAAAWALLVRRVTAAPFWLALVGALTLTPAFGSGGDALVLVDMVMWSLAGVLGFARVMTTQPFARRDRPGRDGGLGWALPAAFAVGGALLAAGFHLLGPALARTSPLAVTVTACEREYRGDPRTTAPTNSCDGQWRVGGQVFSGELPVTGHAGQTVSLRVRPSDPATPLTGDVSGAPAGLGLALAGMALALVSVCVLTWRTLTWRQTLRAARVGGW